MTTCALIRRFFGLACALVLMPVYSQQAPSPLGKETLTYGVEWRLIRAGTAKLSLTPGHNSFQGDVRLESAGLVSKLYHVDDDYRVRLEDQLCATSILIKSQEGKRSRETKVGFDRAHGKASYLEKDLLKNATVASKEIEVPACVQDIFGGLEKMRTLKLEPGQSAVLPVSDGKKFAQVKVEAQEHEEVKTPTGTYKTTRYEVYIFNDVLINRRARVFVWLSDDPKRLPVQIRVRMQFLIGTINLALEKEEH
jgi:hypothetical protein